jgi:hypothetical protein
MIILLSGKVRAAIVSIKFYFPERASHPLKSQYASMNLRR